MRGVHLEESQAFVDLVLHTVTAVLVCVGSHRQHLYYAAALQALWFQASLLCTSPHRNVECLQMVTRGCTRQCMQLPFESNCLGSVNRQQASITSSLPHVQLATLANITTWTVSC